MPLLHFKSLSLFSSARLIVSGICLSVIWAATSHSQTFDEIDRHCGAASTCAPVVQIQDFTPGNSLYTVPLDSELDLAAFKALVEKKVPRDNTIDIMVVTRGEQTRTSIAPINPSATAIYKEFTADKEGRDMATAAGLRPSTSSDMAEPVNLIAENVLNGYPKDSTIQLVRLGTEALVEGVDPPFFPSNEIIAPLQTENSTSQSLNLDDAATDPTKPTFWQRLRNEARANPGALAASLVIVAGVTGLNTVTIVLSTHVPVLPALIAAGLMGTVAGAFNFWAPRLSKWLRNDRWVFQVENPGNEGKTRFGRFLRLSSKRFMLGWTLGMTFRITFRLLGIMPGWPTIADPVTVAGSTLTGVLTGHAWSRVSNNLGEAEEKARKAGRQKFLLGRFSKERALSFVLTVAYQIAGALLHLPGYEKAGIVMIGLVSAAGVPFWIYQSISFKEVKNAIVRTIKRFNRYFLCSFLGGKLGFGLGY